MLFPTHMIFFLNLKEDILRNVSVVFIHTVEANGHQNCLLDLLTFFKISCSTEEIKMSFFGELSL